MGNEGQLPQHSHRLPAARRAPGLAGRPLRRKVWARLTCLMLPPSMPSGCGTSTTPRMPRAASAMFPPPIGRSITTTSPGPRASSWWRTTFTSNMVTCASSSRTIPGMRKWITAHGDVPQGRPDAARYLWRLVRSPESPELIHSKDPTRKTDGTVIGTTYFYRLLRMMENFATVLGKQDEARNMRNLRANSGGLQQNLFPRRTGHYSNGSETSSVLPLAFGMVPEGDRQRVAEPCSQNRRSGQRPSGYGPAGRTEHDANPFADTATRASPIKLRSQPDLPRLGIHDQARRHDHLGTLEWRYREPRDEFRQSLDAGGRPGNLVLRESGGNPPRPAQPAFKHIIMRPTPVGDLTAVKASYNSPYGKIVSEWTVAGGPFHLERDSAA